MSNDPSTMSSSSTSSSETPAKRIKTDPNPNWSQLPPDLLSTVFSFLPSNTDCINFRAVCPSWRSASPRRLPFPFVISPPPARIDEDGHHFCPYFDFVASFPGTADIPELQGRQFCGSTDGWLVLRGNGSRPPFPISIFNPLTDTELRLPSFNKSPDPPEKIVLSSFDPDPSVAVALMSCNQPLYLSTRGVGRWRPLQGSSCFHDAVSFNGALYAVDSCRKIFVYSPIAPQTVPVQIQILEDRQVRRGEFEDEKNYLVEWSGELFLVIRSFSCSSKNESPVTLETDGFEVYKLDLGKRGAVEVTNLGDGVFFLGVNTSFALSATNLSRLMPFYNEIYFNDDGFSSLGEMVNREDDCGCFYVDRGEIYRSRRTPEMCYPVIPPAIFFVPSL